MHFIHEPYQVGETIAAICTPPGEGGIAVIRICGKEAIGIAGRLFSSPIETIPSHTVRYGILSNIHKERLDDVLLLVMRAPRSYTAEDTVEIFCHGGSLVTRRVLEAVLDAGARQARNGEFTFKAFMNGRLDLSQAEAVQELIAAKNERALQAAESQLEGKLSQRVLSLQKKLTQQAAILEAWVDFPEEGIEFTTIEAIIAELSSILEEMDNWMKSFHDGRILKEGISLCLVGSPNVGKSSLMNALLERERAIVSSIPGTTRDLIEEDLRINGLHLRLIDTAGIRHSDELIEIEGIKRTHAVLGKADLILLVMDAHKGIDPHDRELIEKVSKEKTILIWNKIDLNHPSPPALDFPFTVHLSAKNGLGIEELRKAIDALIWQAGPPSKEEVIITNIRHQEALKEAHLYCKALITGLKEGHSPEFLSFEMRSVLQALGKIIGTNVSEDILSSIFSTFCIGK